MNYTLYTQCPHCGDRRVTVLKLLKWNQSALVNCDCGDAFAVYLRVNIQLETIAIPRPHWHRLPSLNFEI